MKAPAAVLAAAAAGLLLLVPGATAAAVAVPAPAGCPADNCLRALRATQTPGRLAAAQSFCAAYTAATGTAAAAAAAAAAPTVPAYAAAACASNHAGPLAARLSSACACIGSATATTTTPTASATEEPCALASSAWAAQTAANPTAVPTIAAALAEACLASAPLDAEAALALVDAIEPYLEWQSDAAYKAKPPADYYYPAYDMFAALAAVRAKVAAGAYAGEAAFQRDLYVQVFGQGHDGHMVFYPDLLTSVFDYGRGLALVSISDDAAAGAAPAIKLLADVRAAPATAPVLELINGVPAAQYVQQTIDAATYNQDPDGAYNSMFYSPAGAGGSGSAGYWARGGRIRFLYPGAATNYTFANGSTVTVANEAYVRAPLAGVTDGASLFARFCAGARSPTGRAYKANTTAAAAAPSTAYAVPGYPAPVNSTSDGTASCYFLDGAGFEDVAVLALLSFEPAVPAEFQAVTHACLAAAVAAGRTRLVVDVSDNGGGYILLGYDVFRQLFPRTVQDGFSRWKANAGFAAVARVVSALSARLDPATSPDADAINLYESVFDARYDLDVANRPFASFAAKFAPHVYADTPYTALLRWNLDDPLTTVNATFGMGMALSGYGPLANLSAPGLDDVVLLYDGVCASTCTLASEMLRLQGGVRAVALGGRPAVAGQPIQGVGGIKGAQVYQFADIYDYVQEALALVQNGAVQVEGDTNATVAALARYSNLPIRRSTAAAINVRDQILRGNVADGLPAQYVREDADCRLYYTADMVADVTAGWRAAAHAAFRGGACAAGALPAPAPAAAAAAARSRRTQPKRAVAASAQAASAVLAAQVAAGFRPLDLAAADRARFDAEFNQKVIV